MVIFQVEKLDSSFFKMGLLIFEGFCDFYTRFNVEIGASGATM